MPSSIKYVCTSLSMSIRADRSGAPLWWCKLFSPLSSLVERRGRVGAELWGLACPNWPRWTFFPRRWCPTPKKHRHPQTPCLKVIKKLVGSHFSCLSFFLLKFIYCTFLSQKKRRMRISLLLHRQRTTRRKKLFRTSSKGRVRTPVCRMFWKNKNSLLFPLPLNPKLSARRHSKGADRRGKTAGPALRGVLVILWARQQDRGESSCWAGGCLLRLQWQGSGG